MQERTAFTRKAVHSRIIDRRVSPIPICAEDVIDPAIFPVALLIKGHGGLYQHAVIRGPDAVEHGGHIPVIPDVVRAPAVDGNRCDPGQALGHGVRIGNADVHDLNILMMRDKGCDLRAKAITLCLPPDSLPHEARCQAALVLLRRKAGGLLLCGSPRG